jgi:hypothetical protein
MFHKNGLSVFVNYILTIVKDISNYKKPAYINSFDTFKICHM